MKLFFSSSFVFIIFFTFSCKSKESIVTITGSVDTPGVNRVYFTDAYEWETLLDSCDVVDGRFKLLVSKEKYFNRLSSIYFKDSLQKLDYLSLINDILSPDSIKYLESSFLIDTTHIQINFSKRLGSENHYKIVAGTETKALFRTQMMQFGYLDANVTKRSNQLKEYVSVIKEYPNSHYLLTQVDANKAVVKKGELKAMLSQFSESLLATDPVGKKLAAYLANKKDEVQIPNFTLPAPDGKTLNLFDATAKINMVVVWASWCGPCRQEIPALKQLNTLFGGKGLTITSVSIDEDNTAWLQAIKQEKMPWKQLLVPKQKKDSFNTALEVGSIPYVLFLDDKGNLISRTIGVDASSFNEYKSIIEPYVK